MSKVKKIGILTSGGDAPGMNACVRAVTRFAIFSGLEVVAVERGFAGLVEDTLRPMNNRSVSDIIQRGGTILKTARCPEFVELSGQEKAFKTIQKHNIDALVIIGGNGTFMGGKDLTANFGVNTVCIPGTIDNDLSYTDYTLGFDTAVNTVLTAINNIRDTMTSHDRVSIIEVMGRKCGDIAVHAGLSGGAEIILVPEIEYNLDEICSRINENQKKGKNSDIIVLAEGVCKAEELRQMISDKVSISLRCTTLGHIQRGGTPSRMDRILAAQFGVRAVEVLMDGRENRVVGIRNGKIIDEDMEVALARPRVFNEELYRIATSINK